MFYYESNTVVVLKSFAGDSNALWQNDILVKPITDLKIKNFNNTLNLFLFHDRHMV